VKLPTVSLLLHDPPARHAFVVLLVKFALTIMVCWAPLL
jgi:hypothetical protein